MGDQGNSCDGMRTLREWLEADLLGDIQKVYCWTNRPVWPQGIPWPSQKPEVPKGLNWDLWVGTAEYVDYIDNLVPFNWRGWWRFGTGALGDMGCHIIGPPFKLLQLGYPTEVSCSTTNVYSGIFEEAYYPESCPVASSIRYKFKKKDGSDLNLYWMDGGIMPERFEEIDPDADMTCTMGDLDMMDVEGATVFVGTKGMASCGWGGSDPRFWPKGQKANKKPLFDKDVNIPHKYKRIEGGTNGHYWAWIDSCIAGYDKADVESPFEGYAGPLTETVLMGNLILRSYNIREQVKHNDSIYGEREGFIYPGRNKTFQWDGANMRITNFEQANQFINGNTAMDGKISSYKSEQQWDETGHTPSLQLDNYLNNYTKMKKIYSSIMAVALFASALSCTSGNNNNTNNAGTQTAQTQALDSDGIPTGGEWITMFDGKTLNGWRGYCRQDVPQGWVVEDGSITYKGSDNKADTGFGDLIYDKKFKNFVFEIEWKIDKAGNSGIFYTAQEIEGTPIYYSSPEYQLLDNENMPDAWEGCDGNRQAGAVYDMIMPDPQPVKPYGNWNKTRIVVYNQRVIHYMNDVKVLEFQFGTPVWRALVDHSKFSKFSTSPEKCPEAYDLMLQCGKQPGYIGMQDHGYGVCFRNIRIKEL